VRFILLSLKYRFYEIYIAALQGNYSEALPTLARAKISFKEPVKGLDKSRGREQSSHGRLCQAEGPTMLFNDIVINAFLI